MRKIVDLYVQSARFLRINCVILAVLCNFSALAYTIDPNNTHIARGVDNYVDLTNLLARADIETIIVTKCITLKDGAILDGDSSDGEKTIQVEHPFLPESGRVRIGLNSERKTEILEPAANSYSTNCLFEVEANAKVTIKNLTLMGGFAGSRIVNEKPSVGGIDNYGFLKMENVDMLRTGTALLNRPHARALLVECNIVRNANWYGGGILNFSEQGNDEYTNGGTLLMDRCSLTENESLGPEHGGGAAENQGLMLLNNCIVANNASTEIGGGINNCKGGRLFVMNSTFTGNVTTSTAYGTMAGGAIGNAGGASHVHIVNSILAYNGYDNGSRVASSSVGNYDEDSEVHVSMLHSAYDAVSGLPRIEMDGTTKEYSDLFGNIQNEGVVAAGAQNENGKTSTFDHPLVARGENDDSWALSPAMRSQTEDHYVFQNSVTTYFAYEGFFDQDMHIHMAFETNGVVTALGTAVSIPPEEEREKSKVTVAFDGTSSRSENNFIGAAAVVVKAPGTDVKDEIFYTVKLGEFTGGHVSGVTIYNDSYREGAVVTVHGIPDSAHYLDGWILDKENVDDDDEVKVSGSEQQYIFSFEVTDHITITPIFKPVVTQIIRVRQRYPWNNLVDIDYTVAEKDAIDYRLVFIATYTDDNGEEKTLQLKSFVKNSGKNEQGKFVEQRLGQKRDLRVDGSHRVTWDSAKDGVRLKNKAIHFKLLACEGDER